MKRIQNLFTFSNIIALLALFIALSGTVYAASSKISGQQIKPKSIPGNRIKANSLNGSQLKAGTLTAKQIKTGSLTAKQIKPGSLTGKEVVGSTLTGVNASGLATVQYVVAVVALAKDSPAGTSGIATCPAGQSVIGGGATVSNDASAFVNDSGPAVPRTGWTATGWSGLDGVTMSITAICAPVASALG